MGLGQPMGAEPSTNVVELFDRGFDPRCRSLYDELAKVLRETSKDMSTPSVLGVLRLLEHAVILGGT